jgi:hypothetical protein
LAEHANEKDPVLTINELELAWTSFEMDAQK